MTKENETNNNDFIMLPTVDFCFKELMQNPKVRQGFIAALLDVEPHKIRETKLLPTILPRNSADDKLGILDVRVLLFDGTQMDLEMQVAYFAYWDKRVVFYLSKMYTDQLKSGESYEKLQKCMHVSILDFICFPEDKRCYRTIRFMDSETNEPYSDLMEIKILELRKLSGERPTNDSVQEWMKFFSGKNREEFEAMAKTNEYINEAYETLLQLSADEKKRLEYEAREKALKDYNTQMSSALKRGQEIGEQIGEERGLKRGEELGLKALVETLKPLLPNFDEVYQMIKKNKDYSEVSEEQVRKYY